VIEKVKKLESKQGPTHTTMACLVGRHCQSRYNEGCHILQD